MPGIDFSYLTEWEESSSGDGEKVRVISTGTGFSRALLFTALALLLVEQIMAWNFIAGVGLLLSMILSTVTWNVWQWDSLAGAMIAFLIAICLFALAMKYRNRFGSVNW